MKLGHRKTEKQEGCAGGQEAAKRVCQIANCIAGKTVGGAIKRLDRPILGMEFDSLPLGAFCAPIGAMTRGQQRQSGRPFDSVSRTLNEISIYSRVANR